MDGLDIRRDGGGGDPETLAAAVLDAIAEPAFVFDRDLRLRLRNTALTALLSLSNNNDAPPSPPSAAPPSPASPSPASPSPASPSPASPSSASPSSVPLLLGACAELGDAARRRVLTACRAAAEGGQPDALPVVTRSRGVLTLTLRPVADGWLARLGPEERSPGEGDAADPADRDALTGLANRRRLRGHLGRLLAGRARHGTPPAVLLLSLDRFKPINDTLGHPAGDALLRLVARRMTATVRADDLVCRVGGDEFAVALADAAAARTLAARLVEVLSRPYLVMGHLATIGASVGVADAGDLPDDGGDELVRRADLALRQAKQEGGRAFRCFAPELDARARNRRELENDLRRALPLRQFELHHQPQIDLATRRLVGFESLLRWRHPVRGLVAPDDFIPLAEEIGVIVPIGEWVLRAACREAAGWAGEPTVAVNVAALQLEDGPRLVRAVRGALDGAGLPARRLEIEITESALVRREGDALATLHALRDMGVQISMDDFGTGYSSLSRLRSFPFTKLKIDRSFVRDLGTSDGAVAMVRAIAALGASLGMTTTAEGVETREQARIVRDDGCTAMQGFLVSRPLPAGEIGALITRLDSLPFDAD